MEFFERCLDVSKRANDTDKEAECYQQIGLIYEQQGDLEASIEYLNKFLDICEETKNKVKAGQAHKKLAETY